MCYILFVTVFTAILLKGNTLMKPILHLNHFLIIFLILSTTQNHLFAANTQSPLPETQQEEFDVAPDADLMREHGVLNRVFLIYEEIIRRINNQEPFAIATLDKAVNIIRSFIEEYHEKLEEDYIFPLFEQHKRELSLVATLKKQHSRGREITAALKKLTLRDHLTQKDTKNIKRLLKAFITMYRPHEAREDTVLFPQIRSLLSQKQFQELGDTFEKLEHEFFGEDGFESVVKKVADIEKELGIYILEQFTPKSPSISWN
jgi:hemerythrin-like domain-containing protein